MVPQAVDLLNRELWIDGGKAFLRIRFNAMVVQTVDLLDGDVGIGRFQAPVVLRFDPRE